MVSNPNEQCLDSSLLINETDELFRELPVNNNFQTHPDVNW